MGKSSRLKGQAQPARKGSSERLPWSSSWRLPAVVFLLCFGAYLLNGGLLVGWDQEASMRFSVNLLTHHSLSLAPPHAPEVFTWTLEQATGDTIPVKLTHWDAKSDRLYRKGQLRPSLPYSMVPTVHPGQYASAFGIGSALTILPVYAALNLVTDIASNRSVWWWGAKVTASLLTAGAAVFIFLTMRRFVPPLPAALGALTFGLGTCAWTLSSQALWQQTTYLFFLSLGAWWLVGVEARPRHALYCGAAFGMATLCRPTGVIPVALVGVYLLWLDPPRWLASSRLRARQDIAIAGSPHPSSPWSRPRAGVPLLFLTYALGGLPFAVLLGLYNAYYFGSPFVSGQMIVSEWIAQQKGMASVWQTPLAEGLAGLLISPSRGLLVYSPVLVFGFVGAVMAWRDPRKYAPLIPLQLVVLGLCVLSAKHFDWWGGWAYGPRRLFDAGVFLTLQMIPVIVRVTHTRWMRGVFVVLLVYSVSVQVIGAWAYNTMGWNNKNGMDIDHPEHHSRLWSLSDNQIVHYATHFQSERSKKQNVVEQYLNNPTPIVIAHPPGESSP
ncbi:MAG: hypothetical protein OXU40_02545 [Nitrospira sp.]|nr:hypothetical protein [Nitrospira sp.]